MDLSKIKGDVTDLFFDEVAKIQVGDIVKSPIFPLLHGTHALEVGNTRLDSYLLEQVDYQRKPFTESQALGISTGLLRALSCWLSDNVSLSNSVLGYEPLCDILDKYNDHLDLNFLSKNGSWDDIVDSIIVGVIGCVKLVLNCALQGVVYDDEDITTRTMDLNWFHDLPREDILDVLLRVKKWTKNQVILDIVNVLECWINFESLLYLQLKPFKPSDEVSKLQLKLTSILEIIQSLGKVEDIGEIPENCFNTNALRKYNNFIPPKPVTQSSWESTICNFTELFQDTFDILQICSMKSILEFREWLSFLMDKRHTHSSDEVLGLHVVPRIMLQLFFIRDDESILGDPNFKLDSLLWMYMKQITMTNSSLDLHSSHFELQISQIVQNLKVPFNQCITAVSQNPSRQRQLLSKNSLFWDKFQAEFPQIEFDFNKVIPDVNNETQAPLMPLTAFLYFEKLEKMIKVILKSVELQLFKDVRELTNGYFVLIYIIDHMLNHLVGLSQLYEYRLKQIESYPKKIKKLSGEKKSKLKNQYEFAKSQSNEIETTINYWKFKTNYYNILKSVSEIKLTTLQMLCSIGFSELPPLAAKKVSKSQLYSLQWKPFNSIGVPSVPLFNELEVSISSFSSTFKKLVEEGKGNRINMLVDDNMKNVSTWVSENEELISKMKWRSPLTETTKTELISLKRETVTSKLELSKMVGLITTESTKDSFNLNIKRENRHSYFPGLELTIHV